RRRSSPQAVFAACGPTQNEARPRSSDRGLASDFPWWGSLLLSQFPVDELDELDPLTLGISADGLLVILHERLLGEDALGIEVLQTPFNHLVDDVLGLPFLEGRLAQDLAFLVDDIGRDVFLGQPL